MTHPLPIPPTRQRKRPTYPHQPHQPTWEELLGRR